MFYVLPLRLLAPSAIEWEALLVYIRHLSQNNFFEHENSTKKQFETQRET